MKYLKERIKHAVRFRHKRGFGVHSPFMFNLILNVIRDKERLFVYPEGLEKDNRLGHREKKVFRLLSRLTRYLDSCDIACFGVDAVKLSGYLHTINKAACVETNGEGVNRKVDFVYIGRNAQAFLPFDSLVSVLMSNGHERTCIVIADIYKTPFAGRLWRQLGEKATVRVDMMWYGILFFDEKLQKGKYNLII